MDDIELAGCDFDSALELCRAMSGVFTAEENRRDSATDIMRDYFGLRDALKPHVFAGNRMSDASYHVTCASASRSDGSHFVISFIREYKNEVGTTSQSPLEQAIGHYLLSLKQDELATSRSNHPTVLMTLVGPYLIKC